MALLPIYKYYEQKKPPEMFYKKGILENLAKFTGKNLCRSPLLIKLQASNLALLTFLRNKAVLEDI